MTLFRLKNLRAVSNNANLFLDYHTAIEHPLLSEPFYYPSNKRKFYDSIARNFYY